MKAAMKRLPLWFYFDGDCSILWNLESMSLTMVLAELYGFVCFLYVLCCQITNNSCNVEYNADSR